MESHEHIKILYDAGIQEPKFCQRFGYALMCRAFNRERSYLYIRKNSIEKNVALGCLCCPKKCLSDNVEVIYFDRHHPSQ